MFFAQQLAGAVFVSVGQNLFDQRLVKNLANVANINPKSVTNSGATELRKVVSPQELPVVLVAYNNAIQRTLILACVMGALMILGSVLMPWNSVKKNKKKGQAGKVETASNDHSDTIGVANKADGNKGMEAQLSEAETEKGGADAPPRSVGEDSEETIRDV